MTQTMAVSAQRFSLALAMDARTRLAPGGLSRQNARRAAGTALTRTLEPQLRTPNTTKL